MRIKKISIRRFMVWILFLAFCLCALPKTDLTAYAANENTRQLYLDWWKSDKTADPETYGWDRENAFQLFLFPVFKHHNVGYTFTNDSGLILRVTKEGGYRQLGQVEIIGYEGDKMEEITEENWVSEMLKNDPKSLINQGCLETVGELYGVNLNAKSSGKKGSEEWKKTSRDAKLSRNRFGDVDDYSEYFNCMATDTYVMPIYGRTSYTYHEFFLITSIAPGAFKDNKTLEYVIIPESITKIPKDCFKGCTNLKSVCWGSQALKDAKGEECMNRSKLPGYKSKKQICKGAFSNCKKLKKFGIDGLYADIKVENKAFEKDGKITVYHYKAQSKSINKFANDIKEKGKAKKDAKLKKLSHEP